MEFVDILNDIMKEFEPNQTKFAIKVGVKQSQVSEWLKGKSKPVYDNLRNICLAFGISADRLLGLDDYYFNEKDR